MTTNRPQLVPLGRRLVPGVLALGLFGVLAAVVLGTNFGEFASFPEDVSITASIGYAMFDFQSLQAEQGVPGTEPFLLAFLLIAIVLDAALDASLVLAKREDEGESTRPTAFGDVGSSGSSTLDAGTDRSGEATPATDGGRATDANDAVENSTSGTDAGRSGGGDR